VEVNSRIFEVQKIHNEMATAVVEVIGKHPDLSHAELQHIFLQIALSWNRHAIRDEREAATIAEPPRR
jgi:hypothetical protein